MPSRLSTAANCSPATTRACCGNCTLLTPRHRSARWALAIVALGALLAPTFAQAAVMNLVGVANPGNPADVTGYGAVGSNYSINAFEVTNTNYAAFLNVKAKTSTYALWDSNMQFEARGGISRSGSSGNYAYTVKPGYENMPVVHLDFYDALRFANWLHNGGGNGDVQTGAYNLTGTGTVPDNGSTVTRSPGALYFLPTEDEWYKAAYHKNDGITGNYWLYPTATDTIPYSDQPPGSDAPDQSNTANFSRNDLIANGYNDGYAVTGTTGFPMNTNSLTEVGAYTASPSPYDTFDQGGNVFEWTETISGSDRILRGGAWTELFETLSSSGRSIQSPNTRGEAIGFRLASSIFLDPNPSQPVPEPGTLLLAGGLMGLGWLWRKKRQRMACSR